MNELSDNNEDHVPSSDHLSAVDGTQHLNSAETSIPVVDPNHKIIIRNTADDDDDPPLSSGAGENAVDDDQMEPSESEEEDETDGDDNASDQCTKQRRTSDGTEIGAVVVNEQAPQLNRRFYLGLNRPSVILRNARLRRERARRRREGTDAQNGEVQSSTNQSIDVENGGTQRSGRAPLNSSTGRRTSSLNSSTGSGVTSSIVSIMSAIVARASSTGQNLITATLVEEDEGEVVVAEQVGFFERNSKIIGIIMCSMIVLLATSLSVIIAIQLPTSSPTPSPTTLDSRPTLEIVQERGELRCGFDNEDYDKDLCRAVAAVIFGNPDKVEWIVVTRSNSFQQLEDTKVDLLSASTTHTVEREVMEKSTGAGFSFSSPYYYDGMAYLGNATLVECAQNQQRFGVCASLFICSLDSSTHHAFLEETFPSDFFRVVSSREELSEMLFNDGSCNVITDDRSHLLKIASSHQDDYGNFTISTKMLTKDPLALVTRNNDEEFSDIINWVVQALLFGAEQGETKNSTLCQNYSNLTGHASDLNFMNAVYCVGNHHEIFEYFKTNQSMNLINRGTGMLYPIPTGHLGDKHNFDFADNREFLDGIRKNRSLNCGVEFHCDGRVKDMSARYCHTLGAALFNGDYNAVHVVHNSNYMELKNGTIDVLAGVRVERKLDFQGIHFSTPYYYGNETAVDEVSFYSLATRDDDALFSSFVNVVVLATLYAEEGHIHKEESKEMPLMSIFGGEFRWALRDAIRYSGNYNEIYAKHFGDTEDNRGRNALNKNGGPQLLSFPVSIDEHQ